MRLKGHSSNKLTRRRNSTRWSRCGLFLLHRFPEPSAIAFGTCGRRWPVGPEFGVWGLCGNRSHPPNLIVCRWSSGGVTGRSTHFIHDFRSQPAGPCVYPSGPASSMPWFVNGRTDDGGASQQWIGSPQHRGSTKGWGMVLDDRRLGTCPSWSIVPRSRQL